MSIQFQKNFILGNADGFIANGGTWAIEPYPGVINLLNRYSGLGDGSDDVAINSSVFDNTNKIHKTRFEFEVKGGGNDLGFFTRYVDNQNFDLIMLNGDASLNFAKVINNNVTLITSVSIPAYSTGVHQVDIIDNETDITVKIDGVTYIDTFAYSSANGCLKKGFISNLSTHTHFSYVVTDTVIDLSGDMKKAIYDADNNGIVDDAERLGGELPSFYTALADEKYAKTGGTLTGDVNIEKTSPQIQLTETGDNAKTIEKKVSASHLLRLTDEVIKAAGIGGAVVLDGTNDYLVTTTGKSYGSSDSHTYIKWFYPTGYSGNTNLAIGSGAGSRGTNFTFFFPSVGACQFNFYVANGGGGGYTVTPTFVFNKWNFISAVYNGVTKELKYYHGTEDDASISQIGATQNVTETWSGGTDPFFIGHGIIVAGLYEASNVDETEVWNKALSSDELNAIFNGGIGRYGTVDVDREAGWHFDEGTGTIALDYSGNGHHLALVNGATWDVGIVSVSAGLVETEVYTSEDGIEPNEEGKKSYGHCNGGTTLQGKTIDFCIGGVVKAKLLASGDLELVDNSIGIITHSATKKWRLRFDDYGVPSGEEVV